MRRVLLCAFLLIPSAALAGKWTAADFPLRVHIFQFNAHSHYYHRVLDQADGEGRANLYENSQPEGFDFSYDCGVRLMVSPGAETYLARWKKPGRVLEILMPAMGGKPGEMNSCELRVSLKPETAYFRHNGELGEEPAAQFRAWMVKHHYDPEHGLNEPTGTHAQAAPPAAQNPQP